MTFRLGIDLGTSSTVAVLAGPDGHTRTLLFDASPLLSSAVFAGPTGELLTGQDAERAATANPAGLEANPKRRIDDGTVWLGEREYAVADLLAAVLGRVAAEARRVAGRTPETVVLTHPAAWATARLGLLSEAAGRAGLGAVDLVAEPVAAAAYFVTALSQQVPEGRCVVVYDLGAGTFDVSVVRRTAGGFEVVAADGLADVGGLDLDAAVVEHARGLTAGATDAWGRLDWPQTAADQRSRRTLWLGARATKEQLTRHTTADLHLPLVDTSLHLTRDEFEKAARPHLERTTALTLAVLRRAGVAPERVAGVFLVGGSSRIPLAATLLHRTLRISPMVVDQPELVVAEGSLLALPGVRASATPPSAGLPAPLSPAPPAAPPAGPLSPAPPAVPAPVASPAGPPPASPVSAPVPGTSVSISAPVSGPPVPAAAVSAPVAGPPAPSAFAAPPSAPYVAPASAPYVAPASASHVAPPAAVSPAAVSPAAVEQAAGPTSGVPWTVTAAASYPVSAQPGSSPVSAPPGSSPVSTPPEARFAPPPGPAPARDAGLSSRATRRIGVAALSVMVVIAVTTAYFVTRNRQAEVTTELRGHSGAVTAIAFSPGGTMLASAGSEGTVRLWDVATGKPIGEPMRADGPAYAVAFSPDGRKVASAGAGGRVQFWNAVDRTASGVATSGSSAEPIRGLSFDKEGIRVAAAAGDGAVQLWSVATGKVTGQPLTYPGAASGALMRSVAFSPAEATLLASAGSDRVVRFWDLASPSAMTPLEGRAHTAAVCSVAFSPDGKVLASGADDHSIRLWDVANRRGLTSTILLTGHTALVGGLSFSPDGRTLVSGSDDKTVRLWQAATGDAIGGPLTDTGGKVAAVAFHPKDNAIFASAGADHVVRLWRIRKA